MKRRILPMLLSLALCLYLLPAAALAAEGTVSVEVEYIYYRGTSSLEKNTGTATATVVTANTTTWSSGGWYVARGKVTINGRVTAGKDAHLILEDGCELTVNGGIQVGANRSLTIYGQSEGENAGKLIAAGGSGYPGIGDPQSDRATITIHGGNVTATGSTAGAISGAGIGIGIKSQESPPGAPPPEQKGGTVYIYGGTVTATGGDSGAGIGGGTQQVEGIAEDSGTVNIYGGTVTATGKENAAGIGGGGAKNMNGTGGAGGTVNIYGGRVTATGGAVPPSDKSSGAGIGGGGGSGMNGASGGGAKVTITGGTVTATGGTGGNRTGPGIGGGTVTISGGTVTANGSAGISGSFSTGTDGHAVIFSNTAISGVGRPPDQWAPQIRGVIFQGTSGKVYSPPVDTSSVTPTEDFTIGEGMDLTIGGDDPFRLSSGSLTISSGVALTNKGTITINDSKQPDKGTITNNGTIINYGKITNNSTITNSGTIDVYGALNGTGTVAGGTVNYKVTGVTLNKTNLNLEVGEEETLAATITPTNATNQSLTWKSDNEQVATVDANGKVTAVGVGTATITATAADGSGKTATCTVTVTPPPVTGVTLDQTSLTLTEGETGTLIATVTPDNAADKTVTWTSSDESVATVDANGKVTAVAPGTATITVTTKEGSFTATCEVTVERPYVPPSNPNYRVDVTTTEGGAVTKDPAAAKAGETVTLTPAPDAGFDVGTVTVTDRFGDTVDVTANPDGTYTFTMPSGQVRVEVTFVEATPEPLPFTDVKEGDWFHDAVRYVYDNGLMDGVGEGQFAPNATTNRAMVVTILYRLAGEPDVSGDVAFTDVADGLWYSNAVAWAAQKGIVNGISETEFSLSGDLTREQLATILYRYAESMGYDVSASADLSGFPDADQIQPYATQALSWAVAEGLLQGFEDDSLRPGGTATRAQIATILMRFCETVAE